MTPFAQLAPIGRGILLMASLSLCFASLYALIWAAALRLGIRRIGLCAVLSAAAYLLHQWMHDAAWHADKAILSRTTTQIPVAALVPALAALYLLTALLIARLFRWQRTRISPMSVKEGIEHLPTGLCFCEENGLVLLTNKAMNDLCHATTGKALLNAGDFWEALLSGSVQGGTCVVQCAPSPILMLSDARVMSFARSELLIKNKRIYQITAADITERYRLGARLREDNRRLQAMNERLRAYGETVREATREKEVLAAKVRLHDELGRILLAARRSMQPSASRDDRAALLADWRRSARLICREDDADPGPSNFQRLAKAAKAVGVSVHFRGEPPAVGTIAARLVESAVHECLTNTVRHAEGTELYVDIGEGARWTATCSNNGLIPDEPIVEGGGLSGLRANVEGAGGTMVIEHVPRYALTISIPKESEETAR